MLRRIGVPPERIRVVGRETRCESLIVPDRLWRISHSVNRRFDDILGRITDGAHGRPDLRLYLSRSEISRRSIGNERDIEELFRRAGFKVLHPQNHGLRRSSSSTAGPPSWRGWPAARCTTSSSARRARRRSPSATAAPGVTRNQLVCGALAGGLTAAIPFAEDRRGLHIPTLAPELAAVLERLDDLPVRADVIPHAGHAWLPDGPKL